MWYGSPQKFNACYIIFKFVLSNIDRTYCNIYITFYTEYVNVILCNLYFQNNVIS